MYLPRWFVRPNISFFIFSVPYSLSSFSLFCFFLSWLESTFWNIQFYCHCWSDCRNVHEWLALVALSSQLTCLDNFFLPLFSDLLTGGLWGRAPAVRGSDYPKVVKYSASTSNVQTSPFTWGSTASPSWPLKSSLCLWGSNHPFFPIFSYIPTHKKAFTFSLKQLMWKWDTKSSIE